MGRKGPTLIIAGIAIVAVCATTLRMRLAKPQRPSAEAADAGLAQGKRKPFRSAVVELTFRSQSLHGADEYLSERGHRTEYIDVAGGRRREDYDSNDTIIRQTTSSQTLTWIFHGSNVYSVTDKEGQRTAHVIEMQQGYDVPIWADSMMERLIEESPRRGTVTISEEEFLGRPCKVYSSSTVYPNSKDTDTQKWWVW